jgi:hypothetical protein
MQYMCSNFYCSYQCFSFFFFNAEPADHVNKRLKPTRPVKNTRPPASKLFEDEDLDIVHGHTEKLENIACANFFFFFSGH